MMAAVTRCGFLVAAFCSPAFPADPTPFDVPGGSYQVVSGGSLVPGILIKCRFEVESPDFGVGWLPSVAIFFESEEQVEDGGLQVRLAALGTEREQGWRHRFMMYRANMDRRSEINVHTGVTESVLQLNMIFTDDESVVFFAGKEAAEYSEIDIAPSVLTKWSVVAAGVTGTADCDARQSASKRKFSVK